MPFIINKNKYLAKASPNTESYFADMEEDIVKNYKAAIDWYQKREQIVFSHLLQSLTKRGTKLTEEQVTQFEKQFIKNYENGLYGPYLRDTIVGAIQTAYKNNAGNVVTFQIGKYTIKDLELSGDSRTDNARLQEAISAKAAKDALRESAKRVLKQAGKTYVAANAKKLYSEAIGGIQNPNETFMRTRYKESGQDVIVGSNRHGSLSAHPESLEVSTEFSFDWKDDQIGKDLFGSKKKGQQFDYMFTIQNKIWSYYYKHAPGPGQGDKPYLGSVHLQDALDADFKQTNSPFWSEEYAKRYGEYKISQNLKAIMGVTNLFLGLGDKLVPMSQFLNANRLYMIVVAKGDKKSPSPNSYLRPIGDLIHPKVLNSTVYVKMDESIRVSPNDFNNIRLGYQRPGGATYDQNTKTVTVTAKATLKQKP